MIYLFAADLVLEQTAGPTASNVTGELASASTVAGTSSVTFTATDPGAGVYQAVVILDGQMVQRTVLDEDGGRCRDVGQTSDGLPAFLYVQPCQPSVSADVALDTTSFPNGSHHLVITVTDPAGNSAPVLDRNITIANPSPQGPSNGTGGGGGGGGTTSSPTGTPAPTATSTPAGSQAPGSPNGVNASAPAALVVAWKGSTSSRLVSSYGRRRTVVGRLTGAGGTPIADAQVEVTATPSSVGAASAAVAQPHTAADGTFTYTVPASASSRTIRFAYRLHLGDPSPVASAALALSVPASIRLSISPRVAAVGRRIFFSGSLQGAPLPAGGKLLVLEARSGAGPWVKFNVIRSLRGGHFQASYRFRFPGPASYRFRVASESEADYPYAAGTSNTVVVRER